MNIEYKTQVINGKSGIEIVATQKKDGVEKISALHDFVSTEINQKHKEILRADLLAK